MGRFFFPTCNSAWCPLHPFVLFPGCTEMKPECCGLGVKKALKLSSEAHAAAMLRVLMCITCQLHKEVCIGILFSSFYRWERQSLELFRIIIIIFSADCFSPHLACPLSDLWWGLVAFAGDYQQFRVRFSKSFFLAPFLPEGQRSTVEFCVV